MNELTIVLPTWNAGFVLSQTIDSIYAQTNDDFKVIIIDDNSTDSTRDILEEIDDDRFYIKYLDKRAGAGNARNIGNSLANTKLISVLDAGDILYNDKVDESINYFKNNQDIDIMCAATDSLAGGDPIIPRVFKGEHGEKLGFEHPGVTYKKKVTNEIKYRTTSLETDQYDAFFFEAGRAGFKFGVYEKPLSSKCTFDKYTGGRDLDKALLVKANIYREFGVKIPDWLEYHEKQFKQGDNL